MTLLYQAVFVGLGGALGAICRFLVQKYVYGLWPYSYPYATFIVNSIGCIIIGILAGLNLKSIIVAPSLFLFLAVGFCGGLTTFSGFAMDNQTLLSEAKINRTLMYSFVSVFGGILFTFGGLRIGRWLAG